MEIKMASLTENAIEEMEGFLMRIKSGGTDDPPHHLLGGEDNVVAVQLSSGEVTIETSQRITTRGDLAEYLSQFIEGPEDLSKLLDDKGTGAFLALAFFETICPRNPDGTWSITQIKNGKNKDISNYMPNFRDRGRFYRHLVMGPLAIFALHGHTGRIFLCQPAHKHPETMEQIAGRENIILNGNLIELADRLYWDQQNGAVKIGATNYKPIPDGGLRRFVGKGSFCEQYGTVYDFWNMSADEISDLLPEEFEAWLQDQ